MLIAALFTIARKCKNETFFVLTLPRQTYFSFLLVLGFELRAYTLGHSTLHQSFFVIFFF
jgi:hypothetical protein